MNGGKRVPGWVWVALVLGYALTLGWTWRHGIWVFADSGRYQQVAANFRHGVVYAQPWVAGLVPKGKDVLEFSIRPPGYPAVLWALGGTGERPLGLLVFQNVLSFLNLALVLGWWAGWARPDGRRWAVALGLVFSFPAQFIYASAVMSETVLQTAVLALVGWGTLFVSTRKARYLGGAGAALVVALLVKPVFYPLAGVVAGAGLVAAWRWRRLALVVVGLVPALVAGGYMQWNLARTGYFHFSSIAEINLLQYNAAGVVRQLRGPVVADDWVTAVLRRADARPTFAERQRLITAEATGVLRAHPIVYARQQGQGMAAFFLDPGRFDMSHFMGTAPSGGLLVQSREGRLWRALGQLPWTMLLAMGVVGLANAVRLGLAVRGFIGLGKSGLPLQAGRWVALGVVAYVAVMTGPLGAARFLVPVWPLVLAAALAGVARPRSAVLAER